MNSFSLDLNKETLFNIVKNKIASKEATSFLLYVIDAANKACEGFIQECKSNPRKFEKKKLETRYTFQQSRLFIIFHNVHLSEASWIPNILK